MSTQQPAEQSPRWRDEAQDTPGCGRKGFTPGLCPPNGWLLGAVETHGTSWAYTLGKQNQQLPELEGGRLLSKVTTIKFSAFQEAGETKWGPLTPHPRQW